MVSESVFKGELVTVDWWPGVYWANDPTDPDFFTAEMPHQCDEWEFAAGADGGLKYGGHSAEQVLAGMDLVLAEVTAARAALVEWLERRNPGGV